MARAKQRVSLTGPSSWKQLDLYQNWYRFDFLDSAYPMSRVNFRVGPRPRWSGTFGAIDPRFDAQPRWTQHPADPTPSIISSHAPRLGRFIAEMADGTQPRFGRLATPSLNTDWSKTVELLLTVTYKRAFGDQATLGPARPPRGAGPWSASQIGQRRLRKQRSNGLTVNRRWNGSPDRHPKGTPLIDEF